MPFDPAELAFLAKKLVSVFALPPLGPLVVIMVGLLIGRRHRRGGLALAWGGVALALVLMLPTSVAWMLRGLETAPPVSLNAAREAGAIVILGGGKRRYAPEYGGESVNRLSLERLRYGARLARETGLPILVTGGAPTGSEQPEAGLMQATLEIDFNVPVRWVESASRDTRENALFSAVHLRAAGVHRIVLVTHAAHMGRAQAEFEAAGLEVVPAPTAWLSGPDSDDHAPGLGMLPGASSAYAGWFAAHEWLGRLAYRLTR